jgi:predicted DNA binding protein
MRKLIVEFPKDEFSKIEGNGLLENVKTMEVLMILRESEEEITMICRVELENEVSNVEEYAKLISNRIYKVQVLERENTGAYIILLKHNVTQVDESLRTRAYAFWDKGGYAVSREMWGGKFRMTYLGSVNQIRETIKTFETLGIQHRIVSITDAKFAPNSPLNALTEKQRRIMIAAYKLGYYDLPRRVSSRELSENLGLHKSALATHIRKAELRLLAAILSEL